MSLQHTSLNNIMTDYFDDSDTLDAAERERAQYSALPDQLAVAIANSAGLASHLHGHETDAVNSREALARLPVLRKSDLMEAQQSNPPFGGFVNTDALPGSRMFMSPGPVWEPQVSGVDPWQSARALHAAGVRRGHRVHNALSYHITPGGFILEEGARALGCVVFPAGVGNTDAQVEALKHVAAEVYVGTPDYLQVLLDRAAEKGVSLPSLTRALVSGGALFPAMREKYCEAGVHVQQCYATADLGVIAYESASNGQIHDGMLVNEGVILEIVKPGTGEPVAAGEVGEMLVTRLHPDYPLLRFATGDMSAYLDEPSPCGRTQRRIRGWMGRADQRTKVRGMFVDPAQIQAVRSEHPELAYCRLLVTRDGDRDVITLKVHASNSASDAPNIDNISQTLKRVAGVSGDVLIDDGPVPKDGIVIDDQRDYAQ